MLPRPNFSYAEFISAAHKQRGEMGISAFLRSETPILVGNKDRGFFEAFIAKEIDAFGRKEKYSEIPPTHWIPDVNRAISDSWGDTIYSPTWFVCFPVK